MDELYSPPRYVPKELISDLTQQKHQSPVCVTHLLVCCCHCPVSVAHEPHRIDPIHTFHVPSPPVFLPWCLETTRKQTHGLGTAKIGRMMGYKFEGRWVPNQKGKSPKNTYSAAAMEPKNAPAPRPIIMAKTLNSLEGARMLTDSARGGYRGGCVSQNLTTYGTVHSILPP